MNSKMLFVCLHNRQIDCDNFECGRCGWNPENKALRNRRVRKLLEGQTMVEEKPRKIPKLKPVYCPELNQTFPSACAAARHIGCYPSEINNILRGERKTAKGCTFVEVDDREDENDG